MLNGEYINYKCRVCGNKVFPDYQHKGGKHKLSCQVCNTQFVGNTMKEAAAMWNGERYADEANNG